MLTLTFHARGEITPTQMIAVFVRFCSDGTLRGPDNYVVARCVEDLWQVGGKSHHELGCDGPVRVRITSRPREAPVHHGPFRKLHTVNGVLHGDDNSLHVLMPGRTANGTQQCHELTLLSPASA